MRRYVFSLLLLPLAVEARAQGAITGVLLEDRAKHPLACVDVALIDSSGAERARTQTASDGGFRFASGAASDNFSLRVSAYRLEPTDLPLGSFETDSIGGRRYVMFLEPLAAGEAAIAGSPDDSPPLPVLGYIAPKYPDELRPRAAKGSVVVGFAVDARGRADVKSVVELQSTNEVFFASVLEAVAAARFRPARRDGRTTCAFAVFSFQFDHARP